MWTHTGISRFLAHHPSSPASSLPLPPSPPPPRPPPPPTPGIITRAALGLGYWCPEPRRREGQGRTTLPSKVRSRGQGQRTSHDCRDGFLCGKHTHVNEHSSWKSPLPIVNFQSLKSRHASGLRVLIGKIYFFSVHSTDISLFFYMIFRGKEGGEKDRFVVPLVYASLVCFLHVP